MPRVPLGPDTRAMAQTALGVIGARHQQNQLAQQQRQFDAEQKRLGAGAATDRSLRERKFELDKLTRGFKMSQDIQKTMMERAELGVEYGLLYDPSTGQWEADPNAPPIGGVKGRKERLDALKFSLQVAKANQQATVAGAREFRLELKGLTGRRDKHYRTSQSLTKWLAMGLETGVAVTPELHAQREQVVAAQAREWQAARQLDQRIAALRARMGVSDSLEAVGDRAGPMAGEQPFERPATPQDVFSVMESGAAKLDTPDLKKQVYVALHSWDTFRRSMQRTKVDPDLYLASLVQELRRRGVRLPEAPLGMESVMERSLELAGQKVLEQPYSFTSDLPTRYTEADEVRARLTGPTTEESMRVMESGPPMPGLERIAPLEPGPNL